MLSYANRRRLEMARALATDPQLILLDEPTAGMNPRETLELRDHIVRMRDELGLTVLVIEHDMRVVKGVSDRVIACDYGRKIAEGTYEEVAHERAGHRGLPRAAARGGRMSAQPVADRAPVLELRNVSTHYGLVAVLRNVDMQIYAGEMVCLLGGNASGKTTTLKTILGYVTPTEGEVCFEGEVVSGLPTAEVVRRGISMVPENRRLFGDMTVDENLTWGPTSGRDRDAIAADRERVLETVPEDPGAAQAEGGHPVGRRAADGGDGPRADGATRRCC